MAADLREGNEPYDDINIVPMLDLAYVLLVTFMILTTASVQGVRVTEPRTTTTSNLAKPQTRAITVTADGTLFLDAFPVTPEQLATLLGQYKAANPNLPVVLKGDANAPYEVIQQVLATVKRVGVEQVGLATKRAQ